MDDDGGMQWWAEIGQYQAMLASDPAYQEWLDEQDQRLLDDDVYARAASVD